MISVSRRRSDPNLAVLILEQFRRATEYCAASLGVVTHAANNHSVSVIREDGKVVNSKCRDNNADHNPHRRKGKRLAAAAAQQVTPPSKHCKVDSVTALSVATAPGLHVPADPIRRNSTGQVPSDRVPSPGALLLASRRKAAADHALACENAFWSSWRERVDKRPALAQPVVCADDRLQAVKRRMLARSS